MGANLTVLNLLSKKTFWTFPSLFLNRFIVEHKNVFYLHDFQTFQFPQCVSYNNRPTSCQGEENNSQMGSMENQNQTDCTLEYQWTFSDSASCSCSLGLSYFMFSPGHMDSSWLLYRKPWTPVICQLKNRLLISPNPSFILNTVNKIKWSYISNNNNNSPDITDGPYPSQ